MDTNQISHLTFNYKDRLLCFSSEIISEMCKIRGIDVIILNEDQEKTDEKELVSAHD